ncbi:MAG TPA: Na+/H+ antiporter NhaA [Acidimicrobiales bacterium]
MMARPLRVARQPPWRDQLEARVATLSIRLGGSGISTDLRHWVNEGLMTLFFLVVGLEAKRELDIGELRQRQRLASTVVAALGGMTVPIAIYISFNAGTGGGHGWGAAMSTDTAFALGALALITPRSATRLRVFLLTRTPAPRCVRHRYARDCSPGLPSKSEPDGHAFQHVKPDSHSRAG